MNTGSNVSDQTSSFSLRFIPTLLSSKGNICFFKLLIDSPHYASYVSRYLFLSAVDVLKNVCAVGF